jgi:hypothetical protein
VFLNSIHKNVNTSCHGVTSTLLWNDVHNNWLIMLRWKHLDTDSTRMWNVHNPALNKRICWISLCLRQKKRNIKLRRFYFLTALSYISSFISWQCYLIQWAVSESSSHLNTVQVACTVLQLRLMSHSEPAVQKSLHAAVTLSTSHTARHSFPWVTSP